MSERSLKKLILIITVVVIGAIALGVYLATSIKCSEHSYGKGVITKAASCTEGVVTYTCVVCGDTMEKAIPAVDEHSFGDEAEIITEATCDSAGLRRYTCEVCGETKDEEIPTTEGHAFDEGIILLEPTCNEEGIRLLKCQMCGFEKQVAEPRLPAAYTITLDGIGKYYVSESGYYVLKDPVKVGYRFIKWTNSDGTDFAPEGEVFEDIVIYPIFELLKTTTVEELAERAEGGAECILITNDIIIDRTIYFTGQTLLCSDKEVKLVRAEAFGGDLFVVGEDSEGFYNVLDNGRASLTLGYEDGSARIIIDGNRDNMQVDVVGSAIFIVNSAEVNLFDGVSISNHFKSGNERSLLWQENLGTSPTMGGAGVFIVHGTFNMYGGVLENNSVNTENVGTDDNTEYISSYGGAIYSFGTFKMYGGVIKGNAAVRGGAIYSRRMVRIFGGVIENNMAYNKGGAICTSESPYSETFLGGEGAESGTVVFRNNVAMSQGGAYLGYHYCPLVIYDGVLFEGNRAEQSIGGAVATAGPVTAYGAEFVNNYAYEGGGAIYQYYVDEETLPHTVKLEGCRFEGNNAGRGGAILLSVSGDHEEFSRLNVTDCSFVGNKAETRTVEAVDEITGETVITALYGSGGAIYITKKTEMTVVGSEFIGNLASVNAGAMFLTTDTVSSIENSSFEGNISAVYGGAVCASGARSLDVISSVFRNNGSFENGIYSTERGGAIYNGDSTVTTYNCCFIENAAGLGGGVYTAGKGIYSDKPLQIEDSVQYSIFEGNISDRGGAVCAYGIVGIEGATFNSNVSHEHGGAIYGGTDAAIVLGDCDFSDNIVSVADDKASTKRYGGAIYVVNAMLTVMKCDFGGNGFVFGENVEGIKTYGGAVASTGSAEVLINESEFWENQANYGGAVSAYDMGGSAINVLGTKFSNNNSDNCGGAMYINDAIAALCGIYAENNRSRNGGAVYVSDCQDVKIDGDSFFEKNTAAMGGGALYVGERANVSDSGSFFGENVAKNGGAIYVNAVFEAVEKTGTVVGTRGELLLLETEFVGNRADFDEKDSRGGAVFVNGGNLLATNVIFADNFAVLYGGAVNAYTNSAVKLENVSFTGNSTNGNGGAFWSYTDSYTVIEGIVAKGNHAAGNGGVIYTRGLVSIISDGEANVFGGSEDGESNTSANGGAIFALGTDDSSAKIDIYGLEFAGNRASESGGAIYVDKADVYIGKCEFEGNTAGKYGGAVHSTASVTKLEGCGFIKNKASGNGGAVYVTKSFDDFETVTVSCRFEENQSNANGGAVYVTGTGAYRDGDKTINNSSSVFDGNRATGGGAIYVYGSARLYGTVFEHNIAENGGALGVNVTVNVNSDAENETAEFSDATIEIEYATFTKNKAESGTDGGEANGGALYVCTGATVIDLGSSYLENSATKGGAIYLAQGSENKKAVLSLKSSDFEGNVSMSHGGAVCVYNRAEISLTEARFTLNRASGDNANGGAVYLYGADATISDSSFESNLAGYRGGAIYLTETINDVVSIDCLFNKNIALDNGGAVYLTGTGCYKDAGSSFEENSAEKGGALLIYGKAELSGTSFDSNSASWGGAMAVYGSVLVKNTVCVDNAAEKGGAIYTEGVVVIENGSIKGNKGGVYVKNGDFSISGLVLIDKNEEYNVYLGSGNVIIVSGELEEGTSVGVTLQINGAKFAEPDGINITDIGKYEKMFHSDIDAPIYKDENGELVSGFVIFEQPSSINGYKVLASGEPKYAWFSYSDLIGVGNAVTGQNTNVLTNAVAGQRYVCIITYASGIELRSEPVIWAEKKSHPVCGISCDCAVKHNTETRIPITSLSELESAIALGGNYYLASDIEISYGLEIEKDMTLCLGGKMLRYVGDKKSAVITVSEGVTLTLTDCGTQERHGYIDPVSGIWTEGMYSGNESVTEVKLVGGIITGGNATFGGGVTVYGRLNAFRVNFAGNTASNGGAVYVGENAEASFENVSFVGNRAIVQGGAIRLHYSTATINNCIFIGNSAMGDTANDTNNGGALYIYYSSAEIKGSSFENNVAGYRGGAIYVTGTPAGSEVITKECSFVSNSSWHQGGAIYLTGTAVYRDGEAGVICGSLFLNNESTANGGAICSFGEVRLYKTVFKNNFAKQGGAISVNGKATRIDGGSFTENTARYGGAVYVVGAVEISGAIFDSNLAKVGDGSGEANGGALYACAGATVLDRNSSYTDNRATKGGAVYADGESEEKNTSLTFEGSSFSNNTSDSHGGAFCAYNYANIMLTEAEFSNNKASGEGANGGAVYLYGADANIEKCIFDSNKAGYRGGAIYLTVTINEVVSFKCVFISNVASNNGGAVYLTGTGAYRDGVSGSDENGSTFESNSASNGGALISHGEAFLYGSSFSENLATSGGGAIYVGGKTLTVKNAVFNKNSSKSGGAIYNAATAYIYDSSFVENSASAEGGAIFGSNNTNIYGSEFSGNLAICGGALYADGATTVERCAFEKNSAIDGGAVFTKASLVVTESQFDENFAENSGGALFAEGGVKIVGSSFANNRSEASGGAIYVAGEVKLTETELIGNISSLGGAICVDGKLESLGAELVSNKAETSLADADAFGGAVYVSENASMMDNGSSYSGNIADYGGAIYLCGSAKTNNSAFKSNLAKMGGAVYLAENAALEDKDSRFESNTASSNGGAIYTYSEIILDGTEFCENSASTQGGAIYLNHTSAQIDNAEFERNKAIAEKVNTNNQGGAIYIYYSFASIESSSFNANEAGYRGGALYMTQTPSGSAVVTVNCRFTGNVASDHGGAVYATGTGIYIDGSSDFHDGSLFEKNEAGNYGGAACIYGKCELYGSEFRSNSSKSSGGALAVLKSSKLINAVFESNTAVKSGGAVYAAGGSHSISGGSMSDNSVTESTSDYKCMGGAIAVGASTTVTVDGVTFTDNFGGASGGAVGVYGSNAKVSISDSVFNSNSATNGGAIYVGGSSHVTVSQITVKANRAVKGHGAAIYVTSANSILDVISATVYNDNTDKNTDFGFVYIANAADILNVYKNNVTFKDADTDADITVTDWSKLILNPKKATVNVLN